jgi:hypothetical protein
MRDKSSCADRSRKTDGSERRYQESWWSFPISNVSSGGCSYPTTWNGNNGSSSWEKFKGRLFSFDRWEIIPSIETRGELKRLFPPDTPGISSWLRECRGLIVVSTSASRPRRRPSAYFEKTRSRKSAKRSSLLPDSVRSKIEEFVQLILLAGQLSAPV